MSKKIDRPNAEEPKRRLAVTSLLQGLMVTLALGMVAPNGRADHQATVARIPFKEVRLIIEFNSSAEDVGVQFFLDSDGWQEVSIFNPLGKLIFEAEASANLLRQGGGTELFVECRAHARRLAAG
jgi:hypothetical protein